MSTMTHLSYFGGSRHGERSSLLSAADKSLTLNAGWSALGLLSKLHRLLG
jgi:hypothetical protein